jgi:hypothetical protein
MAALPLPPIKAESDPWIRIKLGAGVSCGSIAAPLGDSLAKHFRSGSKSAGSAIKIHGMPIKSPELGLLIPQHQ